MALTTNLTLSTRNRGHEAYQTASGVTIFASAMVGLNLTTGRAVNWSDTTNRRFLGIATSESIVGTSAEPSPLVTVDETGRILENISVTGVTGVLNVGDLVYATDENTFTLTAATNVKAIGRIVRWRTGTNCDFQLFTPFEYEALI